MSTKGPDINSQLIAIAIDKFGDEGDIVKLLDWFTKSGILAERHIVRYLVKHQYLKCIKKKGQVKQHVKLDLADKFGLSIETVNNIIYRYGNIKP